MGIDRFELMLRRKDVGSVEKDFRGEAGRDLHRRPHVVEASRQKLVWNGRAHEEMERILVLSDPFRITGDVPFCRVHLGLGPVKIQFGGQSNLETAFDQLVHSLLDLEGRLGKLQDLAVCREGKIGIGNGRAGPALERSTKRCSDKRPALT
jgi:hypothetical protein